jgi:uncharacterized protein YjbJ (UPF0337 family)
MPFRDRFVSSTETSWRGAGWTFERRTGARRVTMGELTDKIKGNANQAIGDMKQRSADPDVRDEGDAQKLKGAGQELKGKVKGVINNL